MDRFNPLSYRHDSESREEPIGNDGSSEHEKRSRIGMKKKKRGSSSSDGGGKRHRSKRKKNDLLESSLSLGISDLDVADSTEGLSDQVRDVLEMQEGALDALQDKDFARRPEAMNLRRQLQAQNDEMMQDQYSLNSVILGSPELQKMEQYYGKPTPHEEETCFGCSRGILWSSLNGTKLALLEHLINEHMGCTNYYALVNNIHAFYANMQSEYNKGVSDEKRMLPDWSKATIFYHIFYHTLQVTSNQNLINGFLKRHFRILTRRAYHVPVRVARRGNITESDLRVIPKVHEMILKTAQMILAVDSKITSGKKPVYNPFTAASDRAIVAKNGDAEKWIKTGRGSSFN